MTLISGVFVRCMQWKLVNVLPPHPGKSSRRLEVIIYYSFRVKNIWAHISEVYICMT
jgi:hypothetical protein